MTRRRHIATLLLFAAVAAPLAGVAIATPPTGLKSTLLARGAAGKFKIHDESLDLRLRARQDTDVAIVQATLDPGGSTGWHGHPGQSIVIVKSGALTMIEPRGHHRHGCSVQEFDGGTGVPAPRGRAQLREPHRRGDRVLGRLHGARRRDAAPQRRRHRAGAVRVIR